MSGVRPLLYFAYGSNLSRRRIEARLGVCQCLGVACLRGYRLHFHKRGADSSGKCNVLHDGDGRRRVYGGLYWLRPVQARRLDEFEGRGYARRSVGLVCRTRTLKAYTYVAFSHWIDDALKPYDWYRALVIQGAVDLGLPPAYVRRLRAWDCHEDPDRERWRSNMRLLEGAGGPGSVRNGRALSLHYS